MLNRFHSSAFELLSIILLLILLDFTVNRQTSTSKKPQSCRDWFHLHGHRVGDSGGGRRFSYYRLHHWEERCQTWRLYSCCHRGCSNNQVQSHKTFWRHWVLLPSFRWKWSRSECSVLNATTDQGKASIWQVKFCCSWSEYIIHTHAHAHICTRTHIHT